MCVREQERERARARERERERGRQGGREAIPAGGEGRADSGCIRDRSGPGTNGVLLRGGGHRLGGDREADCLGTVQ
jgi:hypothetical protein